MSVGHLTSSGAIYVDGVAGTTARLNFVLRTDQPDGGTLGGSVLIDNIRVFGFVPGDVNLDGDVDALDFSVMQGCMGLSPLPDMCWAFDIDGNDQVDLADLAGFAAALLGPTAPPIP